MPPLGPEIPRDNSPETQELNTALRTVCSILYSTGNVVRRRQFVSVLERPPSEYTSERAYYDHETLEPGERMAAWIVYDAEERSTKLYTEVVRPRKDEPKGGIRGIARRAIQELSEDKSPYERVLGSRDRRFVATGLIRFNVDADLKAILHEEALQYAEDIKQTINLVREANGLKQL